MSIQLKTGEKILFIGDSITDCGRRAAEMPYGSGYVKIFRDMSIAREPEKRIEVINRGIAGNMVKDLRNRWFDDVLHFKPEWLSVQIGINDLDRFLRGTEESYPVEKFKEIYDEILGQTVSYLPKIKILLIDPFYISRDTVAGSFRTKILEILPHYIAVIHDMSEKYSTRLVKTHEVFRKLLKYYETDTFCQEPAHPDRTGHLIIAEEIYRILS